MSGSSENDVQSPLLRLRQEDPQSSRQPSSMVLLMGRAAGQRGASMLVRETAAREVEERRADWGYSKPLVYIDVLWNSALVGAAAAMLIGTGDERPNVPLRLWICGYALQCLVHVVLVCLEFRSRSSARERGGDGHVDSDTPSSVIKRCESFNTMASFIWWIVGFYWVVSGGNLLLTAAPRLYWLAVIFLAFDVFFAIFCVVSACLIGVAICCCLPCIIAILYAVAGQGGASEADLIMLPKYRFQKANDEEKPSVRSGNMVPIETSGYLSVERMLLHEDAECCICLSSYEDGVELHALPCNHHFHSRCIVKWLKMNATCPLCKYNILLGNDHV